MPSDELERLLGAIALFTERGELDGSLLTDDFEMQQAPSLIDTAGLFRGPEGIGHALEELRAVFDDLRFDPGEPREAPDGRFVLPIQVSGRGRGSGIEMQNQIAWVGTLSDGRLSRLVVYEELDDALVAAGLATA